MIDQVLRPTADERCIGLLYGPDPAAPPLPQTDRTPRQAMEDVILEALLAGPCAVMFSGGRDSSVILAIALHVARREGLPLPTPVTQRYPGAPESLEDEWQAAVVDHLGVENWERVDCTGQHEVFGSRAQAAIRRRGVILPPLWWTSTLPPALGGVDPATSGGNPPIAGSVMTGLGGDEVFPGSSRPWLASARARRRPALRRTHEVLLEAAPRRIRKAAEVRRRLTEPMPWILPATMRRLAEVSAENAVAEPVRYDRMMEWLWADRDLRAVRAGITLGVRESGAQLVTPFCDPRVMAALARRWGPAHPISRGSGLHDLAGDLLPQETLRRRSKADFGAAFYGAESAAWMEAWDGSGVDEDRVDGRALREVFLGGSLDARAVTAVHCALERLP